MKNKILAIIPARGGSKGIPKKNIVELNGKPLIAYTIEAASHAHGISKIVVSSDDDEILNIAKQLGAEPLKRPKELSEDYSPCEPVIHNVLDQLKERGELFEIIILLQPTSPLRDSRDIDSAVASFFEKDAEALISVYEPSHSPAKAFSANEKGFLKGIIDDRAPFMNRQDLPKFYYPNGAIFIIYTRIFKKCGRLLADRTIPYMMPPERSLDIDSLEDLEKISKYLQKTSH